MARGYPDYFGFSMFPFYGTMNAYRGAGVACLPGIETTLFTIPHKGRIAGGFIRLESPWSNQLGSVKIAIDGTLIAHFSPNDIYLYQLLEEASSPLFLQEYNKVNETCVMGLGKDYCFGSEWKASIFNAAMVNLNAFIYVYYTLYQ